MTENEHGKNHYEVLGVSRHASLLEIKASYRQLLLQNHPDKQKQTNGSSSADDFFELDAAWKVLSDPARRKEYDAQITAEENDQSAPVQLEIHLSDMVFDQDTNSYSLACRCGGEYIITEEQIEEGYDLIPCDTCTLLGQFMD